MSHKKFQFNNKQIWGSVPLEEKSIYAYSIRINKIILTVNKKKTGIISLLKPMIVCVNEWASCEGAVKNLFCIDTVGCQNEISTLSKNIPDRRPGCIIDYVFYSCIRVASFIHT